jgi:hypothetical protein
MLQSFDKLNDPFKVFQEADLVNHFDSSDQIRDVAYWPADWPQSLTKMKNKTFQNVSFSKTKLERVTFTECKFVDCLFVATEFVSVEFHRCEFKDCNFYKASLKGSYLDPNTIKIDKSYKGTRANVFVTFFQRLLDDLADQHQVDFAANADIRFRQWKRAQIKFDLESGHVTRFRAFELRWRSRIYEVSSGFGYKPWRFVLWTIALFFLTSAINGYFLSESLAVNGHPAVHPSGAADSIFYTFSILTILGFSTITPITAPAKLMTVFEALCAVGWLAILTSLLVKRLIR